MWIFPLTLRKRGRRRESGNQEAEVEREEENADLDHDPGPATRRAGGRRGEGDTRVAGTETLTGDAGDTRNAETQPRSPTLTGQAGGEGGGGGAEVMMMTLSRRRTGERGALRGGAGRRRARPLRRL